MQRLASLAVLLCCFRGNVDASRCYSDYCRVMTVLPPSSSGFPCALTSVRMGGDCGELPLDGFARDVPENESTEFSLRAYVYEEPNARATAFNLSVTNASFQELVTRYQNLLDKSRSACRYARLYGNETRPPPRELHVSCPFSDASYETVPYQLDCRVTGETFRYAKRYVFYVPEHRFMERGTSLKEYKPFVYIDVSRAPLLSLHVQPLPEAYRVTKYKVWLMNNDTNSVVFTDTIATVSEHDIRYNFTTRTGVFYFKVSPVHPSCGEDGCANSTTPFIIIQDATHRLLIMIISTVWIPPVILYVLYHLYKLYTKGASKKSRPSPKCLLVYAPHRLSHINAMTELAKYLRVCEIDATMDMLDATDTTNQGLEHWCDVAFRTADVVLVAASPPGEKPGLASVYRNTCAHLLRLIKENRGRKDKRYYVVQLPYCKSDDVPDGARDFRRFSLPKELPKLVRMIRQAELGRAAASASDKAFLDSVKIAKLDILEEDASIAKDRETENLLAPEAAATTKEPIFSLTDGVASRSFRTNITDVNLLGKIEETEEPPCAPRQPPPPALLATDDAPAVLRIARLKL